MQFVMHKKNTEKIDKEKNERKKLNKIRNKLK